MLGNQLIIQEFVHPRLTMVDIDIVKTFVWIATGFGGIKPLFRFRTTQHESIATCNQSLIRKIHGASSTEFSIFPIHVVGISQQSSLPPKPPAIIVCQPVQKEKHTVTTKPLMLVIQVHHLIKTRTLTQSNVVPFSLVLGCYFRSTSTGIYLICTASGGAISTNLSVYSVQPC